MKGKILLIEDDNSIGYLLSEYLKMKGYAVSWERNGEEGLNTATSQEFDLAIVDVMMPQMDGFKWAETIKEKNVILPFIFLTARSMKIDVLKGFSLGAIDFLKKPIDEEELLVRIENHLKRIKTSESSKSTSPFIEIGNYKFHPGNLTLIHGDSSRTLTARERDILHFLVVNKNQLCSHKDILVKFWGKNDYFNRKSLNVFITKLRSYLKDDPRIRIDNIHNQGFVLKLDEREL